MQQLMLITEYKLVCSGFCHVECGGGPFSTWRHTLKTVKNLELSQEWDLNHVEP